MRRCAVRWSNSYAQIKRNTYITFYLFYKELLDIYIYTPHPFAWPVYHSAFMMQPDMSSYILDAVWQQPSIFLLVYTYSYRQLVEHLLANIFTSPVLLRKWIWPIINDKIWHLIHCHSLNSRRWQHTFSVLLYSQITYTSFNLPTHLTYCVSGLVCIVISEYQVTEQNVWKFHHNYVICAQIIFDVVIFAILKEMFIPGVKVIKLPSKVQHNFQIAYDKIITSFKNLLDILERKWNQPRIQMLCSSSVAFNLPLCIFIFY